MIAFICWLYLDSLYSIISPPHEAANLDDQQVAIAERVKKRINAQQAEDGLFGLSIQGRDNSKF
jgi:hypothetical protein